MLALDKLYRGRPHEVLPPAKRSLELDLLAQLWNWGLMWAFIATGDYDKAAADLRYDPVPAPLRRYPRMAELFARM